MNDENHNELSELERRALRSLREGRMPPPGLQERVVKALQERGLIHRARPGRGRWARAAATLAASLILFAAGAAVGARLAAPAPPPTGDRFVLFLYENGAYQTPSPGRGGERVAEYRAWAKSLREQGNLVAGQKLKEEGALLSRIPGEAALGPEPAASGAGTIAGYFIVTARDIEQARTIAEGCPHLRHGGRILIRPVDPV